MKLLILGGSNIQKQLISLAKQKDITTIVSDYYPKVIGKEISDYQELVSTFDVMGNIAVGEKYQIDGIATTGTDQPVYTVARVCESLGLPQLISVDTALAVTNKKIMKQRFKEANIACNNYVLLKKGFKNEELKNIKFPVVLKPLDSQGQRGIYKLNNIEEIRQHLDDTLSYSRTDEALVEEFYDSQEITVSGWVKNGQTKIFLVTDRKTFEADKHIGICYAHNFPSIFLEKYHDEISDITNQIVKAFKIYNGPIYFQMLVGREGIKVNEIACRIGGAYEDYTIPLLTNINVLEMLINASLNQVIDFTIYDKYQLIANNNYASVQLFFCRPGTVKYISPKADILKLSGVKVIDYNIKINDVLTPITSASNRAGNVVVIGSSLKAIQANLNNLFANLEVLDEKGNNLVINYLEYGG